MLKILKKTEKTRFSRRYPGYIRVYRIEYLKTLLKIIQEDGRDLIELMGLKETLSRLLHRIEDPGNNSAAGKLTRGIIGEGKVSSPMKLSGRDFNLAAEKYYREDLKRRHLQEALSVLEEDCLKMDSHTLCSDCLLREGLASILGPKRSLPFLTAVKKDLLEERLPEAELGKLICLTILTVYSDGQEMEAELRKKEDHGKTFNTSIY
jgi:hypothetical protein